MPSRSPASCCAWAPPCWLLAGVLLPRRPGVRDRLGLRHARRPLLADVREGLAVRRVPGLDARPHRGGHRAHRGRGVLLRAGRRPRRRGRGGGRPGLADGVLHWARAEALGVECKVGIADRAVRVVILSAGLLLASLELLAPAVYVLAALSTITVFQRIWHVRRELTRPAVET